MTWPVSMDSIKESLLDRLESILFLHPDGIKEYALFQILKQEKIAPFVQSDLRDPLELFQVHFLLFHLLYLLEARLFASKKGNLEIHCLMIRINPWLRGGSGDIARCDPLRSYYLTMDNLGKTTRQDVTEMIDAFWERLVRDEKRSQAFLIFDLPENSDLAAIRSRYRQLAKRHHPDVGGDTRMFQKIAQAAEILLRESPWWAKQSDLTG